jgi:hypothetical protein
MVTAEGSKAPDVGAVVDLGREKRVAAAMARKERDRDPREIS